MTDRLTELEAAARRTQRMAPALATIGPVQVPGISPERVLALIAVARAAERTGWNELDGRCWCAESREKTGAASHMPRCEDLRAALAALKEAP